MFKGQEKRVNKEGFIFTRVNPVSDLETVTKNEAVIFTRDIEVSRVEKPKIDSEDLQKNYKVSSDWMTKHLKIHLAMCTYSPERQPCPGLHHKK